jgi:cob(I)alamin adenosyltransferase
VKIYTRKGDDGTTGLLYGGRVGKDSPLPEAYGTVDEAQAAIGLVRAHCESDSELDQLLVSPERDLWVLMAELATSPEHRDRLVDGETRATPAMVEHLEQVIDDVSGRFEAPTEFVVPGETVVSAALDVARTVVRRAERATIAAVDAESSAVAYLDRLSDLVWTLARWQEGESLITRRAGTDR